MGYKRASRTTTNHLVTEVCKSSIQYTLGSKQQLLAINKDQSKLYFLVLFLGYVWVWSLVFGSVNCETNPQRVIPQPCKVSVTRKLNYIINYTQEQATSRSVVRIAESCPFCYIMGCDGFSVLMNGDTCFIVLKEHLEKLNDNKNL